MTSKDYVSKDRAREFALTGNQYDKLPAELKALPKVHQPTTGAMMQPRRWSVDRWFNGHPVGGAVTIVDVPDDPESILFGKVFFEEGVPPTSVYVCYYV